MSFQVCLMVGDLVSNQLPQGGAGEHALTEGISYRH